MIAKRGVSLMIVGVVLILLALVLIVFVSSAESSNTKTYNPETKTIIIKNQQSDILAEIKLLSPEVVYVIRGKDRKVAELTIENKGEYNNALKDMEFYDLNQNNKEINREFIYKYKNITGQGAIIGAGQQLLSGWQIVAIIAVIGGVLIVFIISRTIIRLKEGVVKKK